MKVFLTWSGPRSRELAVCLSTWLKHVIQQLEPWLSDRDVQPGMLWPRAIVDNLQTCAAGVICLTPENQFEPWVLFEAGALASRFGGGSPAACVYLLGMDKSELTGPLALYQAAHTDRDDTLKLVRSLNSLLDHRLPDEVLTRSFDRCWDELNEVIGRLSVPAVQSASELQAASEDVLVEVLNWVRRVAKQNDDLLDAIMAKPREFSPADRAYLRRAHEAQEDIVRSAEDRLRATIDINEPAIAPLLENTTLVYGSQGVCELVIRDEETYHALLQHSETLDRMAQVADVSFGLHLNYIGTTRTGG